MYSYFYLLILIFFVSSTNMLKEDTQNTLLMLLSVMNRMAPYLPFPVETSAHTRKLCDVYGWLYVYMNVCIINITHGSVSDVNVE